MQTCTAERIAYRNMVDGLDASEARAYRNPCREWIGAQIRADAFGYVSPGMPEQAYRVAYLSYRKNGIYGEMFVAARVAAAHVETDVRRIIAIGLSEIPAKSRLTEAVNDIIVAWDGSRDREDVADRIDACYGSLLDRALERYGAERAVLPARGEDP